MSKMQNAGFSVDAERCSGCGLCLDVCPGNMVGGDVLRLEDGLPVMVDQTKFGWHGCWRCQHCLAVCPTGAISILGVSADKVSGKPDFAIQEELPKLIKYRRTCRAFKKDDVDSGTIDEILDAVSAVPTGGNNQRLEFSVVYSRDAMRKIYNAVFGSARQLSFFDSDGTEDFSGLRIYDAPHLFIAHKAVGERFRDGDLVEVNLATAYFELLANAYGLGTVVSTYSAELLSKNKQVRQILRIPDDHNFMTVVGFGYPKYKYARGIAKRRKINKIL